MDRPPDLPEERARLEALRRYGILDTPPEPDFDDVALLAASLCGTPIALMSLVDAERQWFKARLGLDITETARDVSFCAHAIAGTELLEVPDAHADPRFEGNPLVTGPPDIRFYAGMPLVTPEGHRLGTLCVIDRVPRQLTEAQRTALRILSRHVVICLELRRKTLELQDALGRLAVAEAQLQDRQVFAQATVDALSSHIAIVGQDGHILATNRAWYEFARANGVDPDQVSAGADYLGICDRCTGDGSGEARAFAAGMRAVMAGERELFGLEYPCHSPDQKRFFVGRVTRFPGRVAAVAVAHEDITARKLAEERVREFTDQLERLVEQRTAALIQANRDLAREFAEREQAEVALRKSEAYHRTILDNAFDGIAVVDLAGTVRYASPALRHILGKAPSAVIGVSAFDLIHPEDVSRAREDLATLAEPGRTLQNVLRFHHADGSFRWIESRAANLMYDSSVGGILISFRDVSERRRAEDALRSLSGRVIAAQEAERRRISRELHDEIGQVLTAVKISLQTLERRSGPEPAERIRGSIASVDRAIAEVRRLALDLRPAVLDDLGLAAALRWYVDRQARAAGLDAQIDVSVAGRFAPEVETACFRVVQEALTNVLRHARARTVRLRARASPDAIEVSLADDGVGFDVAERLAPGASMGLGLPGMRERVGLLGGRLEIESVPGSGTEVRLRVPLGGRGTAGDVT